MRRAAPLRSVIAVALGLTSAATDAGSLAAPATSSPGNLPLLVVDFVSAESLLLEAMAQEVEAILSPAGLGFEWKRVSPAATSRRGETRVVLLPERARGGLADRVVLGASYAGARDRTVWIYYPAVMRQIGISEEALGVLQPAARRRVGVAFGRVVAHELVHALLPGWPHTAHGLMASDTSGAWLLRRHVRLDDATLLALRTVAGLGDDA